ncbi:LacI family DNA-binding transcriptional regulator [Arthrobacter globiformis]|uniref:LacI family DNA-binding transcriptional regulator n=1 Tax=Arthrobacter globiformis TaxID=1665 RepID=UPI003979DA83
MSANIHKRVTSQDVAREAGVARSTVSYVLNRTPHQSIPDSTRKRVFEAAERLEYTPSSAARTLRRGRSDVVLCLLPPWPLGSAAGALLAELTTSFSERGLSLVTHIEGDGIQDPGKVWQEIAPAAVLTYHPVPPNTERAMRSAGVRSVVVLFSPEDGPTGGLIRPDERIGRMQAQHLIAAGHGRIGYAYPDRRALVDFAGPRLKGVETMCSEAGLLPPEVCTVPLEAQSAAAAIKHWQYLPEPVTAVCAYNDEVAQALIAGARLSRVDVPRELAIIGADDIPTAALTTPPLTTIRIDHVTEARRIVETVTAILAGKKPPAAWDTAELFTTIIRQSA